MNDDIDSDLLRHLMSLARARTAYSTADVFDHGAEYMPTLEEAITESVDLLKENRDLPGSGTVKKVFVMLAVELTYACGDVMRSLGAHSNAEADIIAGIKSLREAGKDDEAEKMEHYKQMSDYALSRLHHKN